ncbi:sensor histidine kinase [Jannaschia ovalis]|uniref:histidine kinase n=1 Tax=Jannaschia ovalis TaxID=3038773 RepID=A0ABY8LE69_9RHOB|nr:ATP-binding protein [Jannaschia sp. GRR-S6-38]WGH79596.1 GAF domain-containing protein [Jannaschia sp. GRR-S6-38]
MTKAAAEEFRLNLPKTMRPAPPPAGRPDDTTSLRTLNAFAVDVMTIRSAEDLFWYVARNVVGRLNFVDCVIYQADGRELVQVAALGEKNPYDRAIVNPLRIPFGHGITGQVAETREPIIIDDLLKDRNYIPDAQPARSEICVPLISQGQVVGVIDSEHPEVAAFGEAELEILTTIAAMTSAKLDLLAEAERSNQRYRDLMRSHAQLTEETSHRKALEAELFEARKLEAIGRLTGGFAHEFNNLLTAISGNLELLELDPTGPDAQRSLDDAQAAAGRGARLIQDMLAFAQRRHLEPEITDLNELVRSTIRTDRAGAGDTIDFDPAGQAWPVRIDRIAAEIALINLILNARDAMPEDGRLRIETENTRHDLAGARALGGAAAGRYVRLGVIDEGTGIPPEALPRIFDPFFTTKPVGEGKGLGLSMVMGFMKQSGGWVRARPGPTRGTTIDLFFPAADDPQHEAGQQEAGQRDAG